MNKKNYKILMIYKMMKKIWIWINLFRKEKVKRLWELWKEKALKKAKDKWNRAPWEIKREIILKIEIKLNYYTFYQN